MGAVREVDLVNPAEYGTIRAPDPRSDRSGANLGQHAIDAQVEQVPIDIDADPMAPDAGREGAVDGQVVRVRPGLLAPLELDELPSGERNRTNAACRLEVVAMVIDRREVRVAGRRGAAGAARGAGVWARAGPPRQSLPPRAGAAAPIRRAP